MLTYSSYAHFVSLQNAQWKTVEKTGMLHTVHNESNYLHDQYTKHCTLADRVRRNWIELGSVGLYSVQQNRTNEQRIASPSTPTPRQKALLSPLPLPQSDPKPWGSATSTTWG